MISNLLNKIVDGGVSHLDSAQKVRAIRLANIISITSIVNTVLYCIFTWKFDPTLANACLVASTVYTINLCITVSGRTQLGRALGQICGCLGIFWFSCYFQGDSLLQLFYFTLSVAPFMYFSWEERRYYFLILFAIACLFALELTDYRFLDLIDPRLCPHYDPTLYNMKVVQLFSLFAPLCQVVLGFWYFLKQSVKFESENNENLQKLEVEYRKQLQVQKMSSLGEMAGGMAHEINNPLAIIMMKTQALQDEFKDNAHLNTIEKMVMRISKIMKALLNFSRNASLDPMESKALQKIVDETLDLCAQRFLTAGMQLNVKLEPGLNVLCRPSEISQVLLNLLNNSYDALYGQKTALVELTAKRLDHHQVEILVEDSGPGVTQTIAERMFEPFFTTKGIGKGTGLGLSISKGIIDEHSGKLSLLQNTGKMSFQILLPIAGEHSLNSKNPL